MKHLPILGLVATVLGGLLYSHASWASGDALNLPGNLPEFLLYSAQGYLGVDLGAVDKKRANALHLKDTHAAEVVMVDHDAPAGKSGLKEHDVILQLDGQAFENADQLRRRLREMPSGRTVTLLISRDGNIIHVTAQLCDRAVAAKGMVAALQCSRAGRPRRRAELPGKRPFGRSRVFG